MYIRKQVPARLIFLRIDFSQNKSLGAPGECGYESEAEYVANFKWRYFRIWIRI